MIKMNNKLFLIFTYPIYWVIGKPSGKTKRKSKLRKLINVILYSASFLFLIYIFFWGPGVPFMPFVFGFESVSDGLNTIYYQNEDKEIAMQTLNFCKEARSTVLQFWHGNNSTHFPVGTDVYLCRKSRYLHLSGFRKSTALANGNNIIVNLDRVWAVNYRLSSVIKHEISHIYIGHLTFGILSKVFVPFWLNEGIATLLQNDERHSLNKLKEYLEKSPEITSATCLIDFFQWNNVLYKPDSSFEATKQYAYSRALANYIIKKHGIRKIIEYLEKLSYFHNSETIFSRHFGETLSATEKKWLSENKVLNRILLDATLVRHSLVLTLRVCQIVFYLLIFHFILWLVRQFCLMIRFFISYMRGCNVFTKNTGFMDS